MTDLVTSLVLVPAELHKFALKIWTTPAASLMQTDPLSLEASNTSCFQAKQSWFFICEICGWNSATGESL